MQPINTILNIRLIQLRRIFLQLGWKYLVLLLFAGVVLLAQLLPLFDNPELLTLLQIQVIASVHFSRKDRTFLKDIFSQHQFIMMAEYGALTFATILILLSKLCWLEAFICLISSILIPYIPFKAKASTRNVYLVSKWLQKDNFEWRAGMRKKWFYILFLHTASFVGIHFELPFMWLLGALGTLITITNFYQEYEPSHFLEFQNSKPSTFLWQKCRNHIISFCFLLLPLFIIQAICFPQTILFLVIFLVIASINIMAYIATKYASYEPQSEVSGAYKFLFTWFAIGIILPIFLPLPLIFLFKNYPKAIRNLRQYL